MMVLFLCSKLSKAFIDGMGDVLDTDDGFDMLPAEWNEQLHFYYSSTSLIAPSTSSTSNPREKLS
jgi:hypothetical protein